MNNTNNPKITNKNLPDISQVPATDAVSNWDLLRREDIMARAEDRRNVCLILSRAHVLASIRWSNTHLYIGVPSTVFAALAGVQAISDLNQNQTDSGGAIIYIILSILVAGLAPLLTFLNPNERANTHLAASRIYEHMGDRYDGFLLGCIVEKRSLKEELDELVKLHLAYSEEKKPLPLTPEWAFQKAKRDELVAPLAREHKTTS